MRERRTDTRVLTLKTGKIVSGEGVAEIETALLDISENGACLLVPDVAEVPDKFQLVLDRHPEAHQCEVRWRSGYRIGIRFQ
jgi:PilZ domain-containing protein